jgi:hypothetical protein
MDPAYFRKARGVSVTRPSRCQADENANMVLANRLMAARPSVTITAVRKRLI